MPLGALSGSQIFIRLRERTTILDTFKMRRTLYVASFICAAVLLSQCDKKNDGISPEPMEVSLPKTQLRATELALLEVNMQIENQNSSIIGDIESESVEFLPNGRFFMFRVPTGSAGTKSGRITIEGERFDFQY